MENEEYKKITGFETPEEFAAYEKGRADEEATIWIWIKNWDGSTNSAMGMHLDKKFKELYAK